MPLAAESEREKNACVQKRITARKNGAIFAACVKKTRL